MIATFVHLAASVFLAQEPVATASPEGLRVGHRVEVRGTLGEGGRFVADKLELFEPDADDVLIGTVPSGESDPEHFTLLGQIVETSDETKRDKVDTGSLAGKRVKIEGDWKGPRRFLAASIVPRGEGRDRIGGRIDELRKVEGGFEAQIMIFTVFVSDATEIAHEKPVSEYGLAEERKIGSAGKAAEIDRDEDDSFGKGIEVMKNLRLLGQLESKTDIENNFDLDDTNQADRNDYDFSARIRLAWTASPSLLAVTELRYNELLRDDEKKGHSSDENATVGETWLLWLNAFGSTGFDVAVGRQDFDDPREWIYDQNLDALRVAWIRPAWRLDLAASTTISDGSDRDEESTNWSAYLSNNDRDKHLAAWTLYRDIGEFTGVPAETTWHVGARAYGEWFPQTESWADFAYEMGDRPLFDVNSQVPTGQEASVSAWGYDVGTTWWPSFAEPLYLSVGYALGSGDANPGSSDSTFRQTGFNDNTDRFGGVTSLQYYGELFDPELSNMGILTLGVGAIVAEKTSLDFIFHSYTQDVARAEFSPLPDRSANVRSQPNGLDAELGWETDLIFGFRRFKMWDLELVGAMFDPGAAFDTQDRAYYGKIQLRYRF